MRAQAELRGCASERKPAMEPRYFSRADRDPGDVAPPKRQGDAQVVLRRQCASHYKGTSAAERVESAISGCYLALTKSPLICNLHLSYIVGKAELIA